MKARTLKNDKNSSAAMAILKGVIVALCVSLVGILIFAFLLRFTSISDKIIAPVNQVIKGVSIFFGVFIGLKKHKEMGLLNGLFIGLLFTILAFLVFSLLDGAFCFDRSGCRRCECSICRMYQGSNGIQGYTQLDFYAFAVCRTSDCIYV